MTCASLSAYGLVQAGLTSNGLDYSTEMNSSASRSFAFGASIASKIMIGKKNTSMAISSMHDNDRFSGPVPGINSRVPGTLSSLI